MLALILGAGGQLGEAMASRLAGAYTVIAKSRGDVDVTNDADVRAVIEQTKPDLVINCSAYTNVDGAEDAPREALAINAWAVRSMARAAADVNATLIHFSTDFVFDGAADRPYTEEDAPNPRSTYAMSKLIGEWFAVETPRHYVLRVESLFGGPRAKSSVDMLLKGMRDGKPVKAFADRTVSPSFVDDVVDATRALVEQQAPFGLYHCVNSGHATWVEVAHELARLSHMPDAVIEAVPVAAVNLKASRPKYAALSNAKIVAVGATLPTWRDALRRYLRVS